MRVRRRHHRSDAEQRASAHLVRGYEGGARNTPDRYVANIPGPDAGHYLELTAASDGSFEVLNARTNFTQKYAARAH
jgi:hypothetical protein